MNRSHSLAALLLAALLQVAPPASALIVTCTNCSSELTQLANNVQLVEQLARQVELVQNAIQSLENLQLNTQGLGEQAFGETLAELRKVTGILGQARSLSIASSDLETQFKDKFKDYDAYVAANLGADGLAAKYQQWSEETNSGVLTALKAGQEQSRQIEGSEASLLEHLERQAVNAEGRMQALQVANQVGLAAARQTQKLRQLMLAQLQLQGQFIQAQMDREAAQGAALKTFVTTGRDTVKTGDGKGF
jgi:P-type conjugative transfer protein TrbJ